MALHSDGLNTKTRRARRHDETRCLTGAGHFEALGSAWRSSWRICADRWIRQLRATHCLDGGTAMFAGRVVRPSARHTCWDNVRGTRFASRSRDSRRDSFDLLASWSPVRSCIWSFARWTMRLTWTRRHEEREGTRSTGRSRSSWSS